VAKKYIRFHYTFSHGGQWLKISIPDFSILFNRGGLLLKSISDCSILFSQQRCVAKKYSRFQYILLPKVLQSLHLDARSWWILELLRLARDYHAETRLLVLKNRRHLKINGNWKIKEIYMHQFYNV
jgi:hypothetical protein